MINLLSHYNFNKYNFKSTPKYSKILLPIYLASDSSIFVETIQTQSN